MARVLLTAGLVTSLITADITSAKLVEIPGRVVPVGIMIFPIRNILGDVFLRPPRGVRRTGRLGFLCDLLTVTALGIGRVLPSPGTLFPTPVRYRTEAPVRGLDIHDTEMRFHPLSLT